ILSAAIAGNDIARQDAATSGTASILPVLLTISPLLLLSQRTNSAAYYVTFMVSQKQAEFNLQFSFRL
ncbi:MAG TPA: hypothetical protein H9704_04730, partial [Candidatus Enterocloster excrementipullorum]|nr:hypothetical protein [Candidatus Enterocloster excrementipullorum]